MSTPLKAASQQQAKALAARWLSLMRGNAGSDPSTHAKIRQAMAQEPVLAEATWLKPATLSYLQQAVTALTAPAN